ncbi:uncharacterized protein VICG_00890 [Vittaforma corneae ATCC 50505]|uniref:Deoxyhypusine monooxygenase n=1 Tax=Vittaforma corneae (strain ATCC 50505) TaxID=993615 RepID=L2GMC1_VITCO|nr:uncharacterized protein VICG_00890 [Vittaforma corneae ATCC 50505]ELA42043.1 hypothetical protein VICG_00890 [Vittaforma corneae ATCC 50505]
MSIAKAVELVQSPKTCVSIKTRALFYLRCLDTEEAALALQKCITNTSVLIDHEIAYILGQMKQSATIPFLFSLARNKNINPIVKHEAIEALGNFEDQNLIPHIQPFLNDPISIISESAVLAISKLEEYKSNKDSLSRYYSRDPAYPFKGSFEEAIRFFNSDKIEEKYKALFYFRDLNSKEAVEVLAKGFRESSDLLRHEIAYVFGQMENPLAVDVLINVLEDETEAEIVRHEAAEALGNIGTEKAQQHLRKYLDSEITILRESARVGLGIYNNDNNDYADISLLN